MYEKPESRAKDPAALPLVTADRCKMRIPGGNGNPVNAGLECACKGPRDCTRAAVGNAGGVVVDPGYVLDLEQRP